MGNGNGAFPQTVNNVLSSTYYGISILVLLIATVVYIINLHGQIENLERNFDLMSKRIDDIDAHGTRLSPLIDQRMNISDSRLVEINKRISEAESNNHLQEQRIEIITERQQGILRRLDRLENNGHVYPP